MGAVTVGFEEKNTWLPGLATNVGYLTQIHRNQTGTGQPVLKEARSSEPRCCPAEAGWTRNAALQMMLGDERSHRGRRKTPGTCGGPGPLAGEVLDHASLQPIPLILLVRSCTGSALDGHEGRQGLDPRATCATPSATSQSAIHEEWASRSICESFGAAAMAAGLPKRICCRAPSAPF
jgi:hypothetical protein